MALDPAHSSRLYLSRKIKGVFEIEQWSTPDLGKTWHAHPLTQNSSELNIRPVVPRGLPPERHSVLWMYGRYEHYTRFNTGIKILP